jgi:ABC-type cobalamin/Fe3+-siderophores transport system ATPase subunit
VALAGPNGAGKTTFYHAHLQPAALRFVNADVLARELELDAYAAARVAEALRRQLVEQRESFVFETVFSDPVGDKLTFLKESAHNLNPQTGERLTQRLKTTRVEIDEEGQPHRVANRRVFYDFTLSPPKRTSIFPKAGQDLLSAFRRSR